MPAIEQLPPQLAMMFDQKHEEHAQELHRIIYISRVHPDPSDLNAVVMVKVTVHLFALDAAEAYAVFSNNVPEDYPVFMMIQCGPVQPGVGEESMLDVKRGPRAL